MRRRYEGSPRRKRLGAVRGDRPRPVGDALRCSSAPAPDAYVVDAPAGTFPTDPAH